MSVLKRYNSTTQEWEVIGGGSGGGGGASTLSDLTDTNISTPTNGQVLTYDNNTSKWVNTNVPTELPSITGNANKILSVNSGATGVEWITNSGGGGGLTNYDFTHTANTTVSGSTSVTFAANQRNSVTYTTSADLSITIVCNNSSDNYIWVINSGSADIDITIPSFTYNGTTWTTSTNIHVVGGQIVVTAGTMTEIGIVADSDGAKITSINYGA